MSCFTGWEYTSLGFFIRHKKEDKTWKGKGREQASTNPPCYGLLSPMIGVGVDIFMPSESPPTSQP